MKTIQARRDRWPVRGGPAGSPAAFSLVEVVLAIGIFSFCLVILVALLPVGLTHNKFSSDRMIIADLCSSIESDLRATGSGTNGSPINNIRFPTPSGSASVSTTNTLYDTYATGSSTATFSTSKTATSQYCFTITLTSDPTNSYPANPVTANILVTAANTANTNGAYNAPVQVNQTVVINRF